MRKKGNEMEPVETARGALDLTRLETKLHLFPFEFTCSDTYVVQCFKTADYSNYWQRERVYAASQRVKRHRPRCKVSLMLPRITSMYMYVCSMWACGFGSTVGGREGIGILCPRVHGNSQSTTARGKWESPKKNASTRSTETKRIVLQCIWFQFLMRIQYCRTRSTITVLCKSVATGKKNIVVKISEIEG